MGKLDRPAQEKIFDRLLTEEGQDQARESGKILGAQLKPLFNPLLVSSAPRTVETAKIFLDACGDDESNRVKIKSIQELYDGTMQPKGSALFKQIGYAPLRTYLEHENDDWRNDAQSVLGPYAYSTIDIIMDTVALSEPAQVPSTLLCYSSCHLLACCCTWCRIISKVQRFRGDPSDRNARGGWIFD